MNTPIISVIICTNDRKDFIFDAVRSVRNQTLPRENYELIVVKGFSDRILDEMLFELADLVIDSKEPWQGAKWCEGIMKARGEIIVFLDDDDLFSEKKLERINSIYSELKFDYYRNEIIPFNKVSDIKNFGIIIDRPIMIEEDIPVKRKLKLIRKTIFSISSSSTVVSKQFLIKWLTDAKEIRIAFDSYLYYLALYNNAHIALDKSKLTFYRKHAASFTNMASLDVDKFKQKINNTTEISLFDYDIIKHAIIRNETLKKLINNDIFQFKILYLVWEYKKNFPIRDLIYYLFGISPGRPRQKLFYLVICSARLISNRIAIRFFIIMKAIFPNGN